MEENPGPLVGSGLVVLHHARAELEPEAVVEVLRSMGVQGPLRLVWREGPGRALQTAELSLQAGVDHCRLPGRVELLLAGYGGALVSVNREPGTALVLDGGLCASSGAGTGMEAEPEARPLLDRLRRKGVHVLQELCGQWGLALFDAEQNRLALSCDRIGARTVYHCRKGGLFAACSHPRAALALAGKPAAASGHALLGCLAAGACCLPDSGETPWAGLRRLRPGLILQAQITKENVEVDFVKFNTFESFIDLPVDAQRMREHLRLVAQDYCPASGRLGLAWNGGPGSWAVAALAAETMHGSRPVIFALEHHRTSADGRAMPADPLAARAAKALDLELRLVPWPGHAELEQLRQDLVRAWAMPLLEPFPPLHLDILGQAMAEQGLATVWTGNGAYSLLGVEPDLAREASRALERRRRILPALLLRRALDPEDHLGATVRDMAALLLSALTPRPYRSTQEQARIELLSHHAPFVNQGRLLEWYKTAFSWRDMKSVRRMQLQRLTRTLGPARHAALHRAAQRRGLQLQLPLLDQRLARYLRLPLAGRLAQGQGCPRLLEAAWPEKAFGPEGVFRPQEKFSSKETAQGIAGNQGPLVGPSADDAAESGVDSGLYALACAPARDDAALEASPLLQSVFQDVPALLENLRLHLADSRFDGLWPGLDALVEWERVCGVRPAS